MKALKDRIGSLVNKQDPELTKLVDNLDVIRDFIHLSHRVQPNPKHIVVEAIDSFEALVNQIKNLKNCHEAVAILSKEGNPEILNAGLTIAQYSLIGNIEPVKKVVGEKIAILKQQIHNGLSEERAANPQLVHALFKDMEERRVLSVPYKWTDAIYHERVNSSTIPQAKL